MKKSNAIELVNYSGTGASMATIQLSTAVPYGAEAKSGYNECCLVFSVTSLLGTAPQVQFDAYEIIDNIAVHIGSTGFISGTTGDTRVIDSDGGTTSYGAAFTSGSSATLRALGKGNDLKITGTTTGTVGTVAYTISAVLY